MKDVYYNIKDQVGKSKGATVFNDAVDLNKRVELNYLLTSQGFTLNEITKEEYESTPVKIDAV